MISRRPSSKHIARLIQNPHFADEFDGAFGDGKAASILAQAEKEAPAAPHNFDAAAKALEAEKEKVVHQVVHSGA